MKETIKLILVLVAFCTASGFLLALANTVTKQPIEAAKKAELITALHKVLPEYDNNITADTKVFKDQEGGERTFYVASLQGTYVGTAFRCASKNGYGGTIEVLIGVLSDSTINDVEILLADKETPGLGSKVKEPGFRDQFKGRSASDIKWAAIKKDGGQVDSITGATISSRAVTEAVRSGLQAYAIHASDIADAVK